jgi:hypothetical protein
MSRLQSCGCEVGDFESTYANCEPFHGRILFPDAAIEKVSDSNHWSRKLGSLRKVRPRCCRPVYLASRSA